VEVVGGRDCLWLGVADPKAWSATADQLFSSVNIDALRIRCKTLMEVLIMRSIVNGGCLVLLLCWWWAGGGGYEMRRWSKEDSSYKMGSGRSLEEEGSIRR
jgi:hypothetical protein